MPDFLKLVSTLQAHMSAELSRSDILRALIYPLIALLMATVAASATHADTWLKVILVVLLVANAFLYGGAYVFCLRNDRDALRSEKYSLNKMAIEHGIFGDSLRGIDNPTANPDSKTISATAQSVEKES